MDTKFGHTVDCYSGAYLKFRIVNYKLYDN